MQAHAHPPNSFASDSSAPDASSVVPLPEKKAMITIIMIREYIGLQEDPKVNSKKDGDRRWYDDRMSPLLIHSDILVLTMNRPSSVI